MKIIRKFQLKIVIFTAVKNRCILHGRVFVKTVYLVLAVSILVTILSASFSSSVSTNQIVSNVKSGSRPYYSFFFSKVNKSCLTFSGTLTLFHLSKR